MKEEVPTNEEALLPVIARPCYRDSESGLRSAYSVRLRTGGLECKGYKILMQTKVSQQTKEMHVTLFEKFVLGDGQEGT